MMVVIETFQREESDSNARPVRRLRLVDPEVHPELVTRGRSGQVDRRTEKVPLAHDRDIRAPVLGFTRPVPYTHRADSTDLQSPATFACATMSYTFVS
jgi:hypothetical protein